MIIVKHVDSAGDDISINFIDENDIFLGMDLEESCCEYFGFYISEDPELSIENAGDQDLVDQEVDLDGYFFDVLTPTEDELCTKIDDADEGDHISVRIIHVEKPDLYIHLFNDHEGPYQQLNFHLQFVTQSVQVLFQ